MTNLLLVEHQSQVQDFLSRGMRDEGHWIALGPSAMWALDREGVAYQIPEDFYNAEELESLCLQAHERVEWLCNRLDMYLVEQSPELKEWGMRPFLFDIFPLTILFDGLVSRIFQLHAILNAYPNHKVWVHQGLSYPPAALFGITFSNKETLWGHLLSLPGWDCKTEGESINEKDIFG